MAAMQSRTSSRRGKRLVSDINVVPYIDVMLVLLVIFMVTAPLVPPGTIDLARAGGGGSSPERYVEVQVKANGELSVRRVNVGDPGRRVVKRGDLDSTVVQMRAGEELPIVITADKAVPYGDVAAILGQLKQDSGSRVGLLVQPER